MRKWTIIALIALLAGPLYADQITLEEAIKAAEATNTDIEVARILRRGPEGAGSRAEVRKV